MSGHHNHYHDHEHEHEHRHEAGDTEDPSGIATWAIGIGGSFLMIATVAIASGIFFRAESWEARVKHVDVRYEQRDMVRAAQHAVLEESAHWVREHDPASGRVVDRLVIPINQAMNIVAGNTEPK
jgi:hypothetical protein